MRIIGIDPGIRIAAFSIVDVPAAILFAFFCALTALFVVLDFRACERRPDLCGETGKFGRRSNSIWILPGLACGFLAAWLYGKAFGR
jgi:hypothetical protein